MPWVDLPGTVRQEVDPRPDSESREQRERQTTFEACRCQLNTHVGRNARTAEYAINIAPTTAT